MLKILFTYPEEVPYERNLILNFMEEGWDYLHLRKPDFSADQTRNYLELLPEEIHNKIVLHDHYELIHEFDLGGINVNERNEGAISVEDHKVFVGDKKPNVVASSAHSFEEVDKIDFEVDYVFMSPVFDSISKEGYQSNFTDQEELIKNLKTTNQRIIALGGVDDENAQKVMDLGFEGFAMLGNKWEPHLKLASWDND